MVYFNEEWNAPMTREKLIKNGSCCGNGCLNCPYTKPVFKGNKQLCTQT